MKSKWLAFLCLGFLTAGCALNRGEVAVQVPETANPESTALVKIVEVSDDRVFAIDPPQPSTPSLMNDEIDDPLITSRAVARKRNTYGAALGDILLPQGQTVEALVEDALAKALKEEGYKVVAEGDPGYAQALSLKARILEFWAWMTPGFWEIALEHQSRLMLERDLPKAGRHPSPEFQNSCLQGERLCITGIAFSDHLVAFFLQRLGERVFDKRLHRLALRQQNVSKCRAIGIALPGDRPTRDERIVNFVIHQRRRGRLRRIDRKYAVIGNLDDLDQGRALWIGRLRNLDCNFTAIECTPGRQKAKT